MEQQSAPAWTLIWDWPLRVWHWLFAVCVTGSLYTGLSGEFALIDWHMRLGYAAVGLVLFRLGWAIWGGRYARFSSFRAAPARWVAHVRGRARNEPRTAPGAALAAGLIGLVGLQALAGLFTSDEIFTEGPLARHAPTELADLLSRLHHNLYWAVLALIGVHLTAHVVYAMRRDPVPLAMFTGRKRLALPPTRHLPVRALLTAAAAAALVWLGLELA